MIWLKSCREVISLGISQMVQKAIKDTPKCEITISKRIKPGKYIKRIKFERMTTYGI